jgi:hypothetical protein
VENLILNVWVVGLVNIYNKTILVMGVEELLIMRIENDLRAFLKTKSQDTVAETIKPRFVRLKKINPELAYDLENKYDRLISNRSDEKLKYSN